MSLNHRKKNLLRERFGRLTVVGESDKRTSNGMVYWWCRCDCGNTKEHIGAFLVAGKIKSCGCARTEKIRLAYGQAAFNKLYRSYVYGSKNRKIEFNISKEKFKQMAESRCYYCNVKPYQVMKNNGKSGFYGNFIYNGIDRKDNSIGYIESNCVPCCFRCNQAKLCMSHDDFILLVKKIYKHIFIGSGTTAKMAHILKRRWIGSEISQEYVDTANKRLEKYLRQEVLDL